MSAELKPCPFCGGAARIESNRDWHRLYAAHDDGCVFDADDHALMYPAQPGYLIEIAEVWNRRAALPVQAGEGEAVHLVPNWEGEFRSFAEWVDKAQDVLSSHGRAAAICVDVKGRRCAIGKDFMRARDEGAFPVRYFRDCVVKAGGQGGEDGRWLTDDQCAELRAKYHDIAGSFNVYEVTIHTELGCKVEDGEYSLFINRIIHGAVGQDDFNKVQESVAEEIDTLALPEEGATSFIVYESGERQDVFWCKFYRIDRATLAKANDGEGENG